MPLTRLLYDCDHAQASLTLSFTTATSIQEPLFWCEELFISGFISEIFHALWKAFYLTCAIEYPHLSTYITNKNIEFIEDKNKSPKHIRHIIAKLFAARRNCITLNHYAHHTHKETINKSISVLRGKAPSWINEYDKNTNSGTVRIRDIQMQSVREYSQHMELQCLHLHNFIGFKSWKNTSL